MNHKPLNHLPTISLTLGNLNNIQKLESYIDELNTSNLSDQLSTLVNNLSKQCVKQARKKSENQIQLFQRHLPKYLSEKNKQIFAEYCSKIQKPNNENSSGFQVMKEEDEGDKMRLEEQMDLEVPKLEIKSQSTFNFEMDDPYNEKECQMQFVEVSGYNCYNDVEIQSENSVFRSWDFGKIL